MANKIQLRRDLSTNWTFINPILSQGEPGLEIDTGRIKYGNGTSTWTALSYSLGYTGSIGYVGSIGYTGSTGTIGYVGSQGATTSTTSTFLINNSSVSTSTTTGALVVVGGIGVGGTITGYPTPGTSTSIASNLGYLGIPQKIVTATYTLQYSDQGGMIYPSTTSTITVPANTVTSFSTGTKITIVTGATTATVTISTDTMYLSPGGSTGTRSLSTFSNATLLKVNTTIWYISGPGVS